MKTRLRFLNESDRSVSRCGDPLVIDTSSFECDWDGIVLEKGWSPHFYPNNVVTPYFYFALARDEDLHWMIEHGGEDVPLKTVPGEIWVNPPWTPFTHKIDEPCFFIILAVEEKRMLDSHPEKLPEEKLQFLNNYNLQDDMLKNYIEMFYYEAEKGNPNGVRYLEGLLSTFSEYYIGNYSNFKTLRMERSASRLKDGAIEVVNNYILENIGEHITIDDLAEELNMSKFYFLKEFKSATGKTPYQYLIDIRMNRAVELLKNESLSLSGIALTLGFSDQSHFSKIFKNQLGDSPGAYRKKL